MIYIELQCLSCDYTEEIPFESWPFAKTTVACPSCGAEIEEERKLAVDGAANFFRTANAALEQPYPEGLARFSFQLRRMR